ncbi:UDP-glucose/GDP-mannose dehydrogenase family protein [Halobacteriovorax sp. GB3]|uniref:UDP-glucose dehydrogenase family protein n=1 Tax=Halobacteriovorax sp. GB3 TaxID=2719615 RepID=UPI002361BE9D|nr:UDP-glucose/GDP-mannose dehydrogenase family protein [Halobacteriovorax sp. GB3]MDD0852622.1 UDP-glucose/GDP-mannose dehydrogenase family protein [Halobacteriovorax sp. GB3]
MKVSVIGTGYVGLVSGTCFAEIGHDVTCIDIDENKVQMLKDGKSPIYEPGLTDLLERNIEGKRLHFSTGYESVGEAKAIFLAVGTPSSDDGQADLTYLRAAAVSVAKELSDDAIVVIKSTVPVGTCQMIEALVKENTNKKFHIVNNPEFLKEGSAVEDFMRPDRVVIGRKDQYAADVMTELYAPLVRQGNPIYMMSNLSAEMTKYAANCFLATKISFINDVAKLCDFTGADINEVRKGIASDQRIGGHFLYPGPGYGGSCFPKDVKALMYTANEYGMDLRVVRATEEVNDDQKVRLFDKMKAHYGDVKGKTFTFWGVAFKANTDDVRETAAIYMAKVLTEAGATVQFFDPVASDNFLKLMGNNDKLIRFENKYDALKGSDALVTMTEWREFSSPDFSEIKERLNTPVIFDGRNLYDTQKVLDAGFTYYAIGKYIPANEK